MDDFSGGLDLRDGLYSKDQGRFRELLNCQIDRGEKLRRRPPCMQVSGAIDAQCQGMVYLNGLLYTIAPRGATIVHTGDVATLLTTLYFDIPDNCGAGWTLIHARVYEGHIVAWIRHDFPSSVYTTQAFLHVWDNGGANTACRTLVQDPYLAASFSPSVIDLAKQQYSAAVTPVMGLGANKLWSSTLRGNAQSSRTIEARVWNQRTQDDLLLNGESFCFLVPDAAGTYNFVLPLPSSDDLNYLLTLVDMEIDGNGIWALKTHIIGALVNDYDWAIGYFAGLTAVQNLGVTMKVPIGTGRRRKIRVRVFSGGSQAARNNINITVTGAVAVNTALGTDATLTFGNSTYTVAEGAPATQTFADALLKIGHVYFLAVSSDQTLYPALWDYTLQGLPPLAWFEHTRIVCVIDCARMVHAGAGPIITNSQYIRFNLGFDQWYADQVLRLSDRAGADDCALLASSSNNNEGGGITSMSAIKQRMLITYSASMQLWAVDPNPNNDALLDVIHFGTGAQANCTPAQFYGSLLAVTQTGYRSISLQGNNYDSMKDLNLGEPIQAMPLPVVRDLVSWPFSGQFITPGKRSDGTLMFTVLDYSAESKFSAWNTWTVHGLTDVDAETMAPINSRLYFRSGTGVYYFEGEPTVFRDFDDTPGDAYPSIAVWHYNQFGKPGRGKRFVGLSVVQDGPSYFAAQVAPRGTYSFPQAAPVLVGQMITLISGVNRQPMSMIGEALAVQMMTRNEAGWRLQRLAVDFLMMDR